MDLNCDGNADILSGSYSRMDRDKDMAGLFQVLWGKDDGTFAKAEALLGTDEEPLIIPIENKEQMVENICTRPTAIDWNGDKKLDLVVGNFSGTFYVFTGEGEGRFAPKPEQLMVEDVPLRIAGAHSDPFVVDWDDDGDLDILSGTSQGGVMWAENAAGKDGRPKLQQFTPLIEGQAQAQMGSILKEDDLSGPVSSTRVWVDDVNADGKLDILLGDSVTLVAPAEGLDEAEFKQKHDEWMESFQRVMKEMESDDAEKAEAAMELYSDLYYARNDFMKEERTGFVWLYLQK